MDGLHLFMCVLVAASRAGLAGAAEITDAEYHSFPKLFHLDEYERCLAGGRGVYCRGSFHVRPGDQLDTTWRLMQLYSSEPRHFNHSYLHRGYCVSSRCPSLARGLAPPARFDRCAARWGSRRGLRLRLARLDYCTAAAGAGNSTEREQEQTGPSHLIYLSVVGAVLLLNVAGTAYCSIRGDEAKNKLMSAWSVPCNWKLMTQTPSGPEQATFAPLQGFRVTTLMVITAAHALVSMPRGYLANPRTVSTFLSGAAGGTLAAGVVMVQVYVMLSSFLAAYHLLLRSRHQTPAPGLAVLPKMLLRRFIRMAPASLLVVGFASTWWPRLGDGPQWRPLVAAESATCRTKFWTHLLFLNNLVDPRESCIVPTWFLAADMQLYVVSTALATTLARRPHALRDLALLLLTSTCIISTLAYVMEWKSVLFQVFPEHSRTVGHHLPHFPFFVSPGGGVQACLLGVALAFVQLRIRDQGGVNTRQHKFLVYALNGYFPLSLMLFRSSLVVKGFQSRLVQAAHFALERPFAMLPAALLVFGIINVDCAARRWLAWRGWTAPALASLPYMLLHWLLLTSIAAARVQPLHFTLLELSMETATVLVGGYGLAVPVTLLAEVPLQRALAAMLL